MPNSNTSYGGMVGIEIGIGGFQWKLKLELSLLWILTAALGVGVYIFFSILTMPRDM